MRPIDADLLGLTDMEIIMCDGDYKKALKMLIDKIEHAPTIEPEREKGKWIERNPQNSDRCRLIECDQCGFSHIVGFNVPYEHWIENRNFCERCGADMRGEPDDRDDRT